MIVAGVHLPAIPDDVRPVLTVRYESFESVDFIPYLQRLLVLIPDDVDLTIDGLSLVSRWDPTPRETVPGGRLRCDGRVAVMPV